jgi:glucokinase
VPAAPRAVDVTRLVAGVDVGGTKVLGCLVDASAPDLVLLERRAPTPTGVAALLTTIVDVVGGLRSGSTDVAGSDLEAVGVGVPALVDKGGILRFAAHLPGITGLDVASEISERLARPVTVDNDANCAAVAEARLGAAKGFDDAVVVTLGTGIGAGIVSEGRLFRGARGFAGEPGHMQVVPHGLPCSCGRRGCWERYASGSGLGHLGREAARDGRLPVLAERPAGPDAIGGEDVVALARQGDPGALDVLDEFARWVAVGLAGLVDLLDPQLVVLGGGLVDAGAVLLEPVRRHLSEMVLGAGHRELPRVELALLGPSAGAVGAALLAAERLP